jgi:16S rRNA (adenine1518-N6/adenine1519-N6)-dimethyltransferase
MKRRSLGQHYLVDGGVVRRMVDAAGVGPGERVLEIGTGRGTLTRELVGLGSGFEGYEIDRENYQATLDVLGGARAEMHLGDAFEERPDFDVLVASLPYSRSAAFVEWLSGMEYDRAVVLLQEDFVRKVLAPPGSRDYRGVSALAQISSYVEELGRVGRASFSPPPKVSSMLVRVRPKLRVSEEELSNIKRLFSLRRRQVASVLAELGMEGREPYGRRRVYSLTPEEVHLLCSPAANG